MAASSTSLTEKPGDRIGRYKLLQQIGEGGCGVVYMAEQEEPVRRRVALKVIKAGMDTRQVLARFEAERQALALMDHPNIARVFDAGATETGRPFFVMELVKGIPVTRYCDENRLDTRQRLELFMQVCRAVQHAHQKGIIHRDIKPSNILVADHDGVPVPKVIDFGLAKATNDQRLTDKTLFTAFEQFIGTPEYMSPEQAKMSGLDIDTRTDIYSLGVLLYELLTGATPFENKRLLEAGLDEIRRIIQEDEPVRPSMRLSTLNAAQQTSVARSRDCEPARLLRLVRGDLDWIVGKCMEKERVRRYETANDIARDIERHLADEPIVARSPSNWHRFKKLVRRNRLLFAATGAVIAALVVGLGLSIWMFVRERKARQEAEMARTLFLQEQTKANTEARKSAVAGSALQKSMSEFGDEYLLYLYSKISGRTLLRGPLRGTQPKSKQRIGESDIPKELGTILQRAIELTLSDKGLLIQSNGAKFAIAATTNDFARLSNWVEGPLQIIAGSNEEEIPREMIHIVGSDLSAALQVYSLIANCTVLRHPATPDAGLWLRNETPLTQREVLYALESIFVLNGISVLKTTNTHSLMLVFPTALGQECASLARGTPRREFVMANEAVARGSISLQEAGPAAVAQMYERLTDRLTKVESNLPLLQLSFSNTTSLHRYEAVYALDVLLAWNGIKVVEQADGKTLRMIQADHRLQEKRLAGGTGNGSLLDRIVAPRPATEEVERKSASANRAAVLEQKRAAAASGDPQALNTFGWLFATSRQAGIRDGGSAVVFAERAAGATGRTNYVILNTLAAAYAEASRFADAARVQREALGLLQDDKATKDYASRLRLYESNAPYHDAAENELAPAADDRLGMAALLRARGTLCAQFAQWALAARDLTNAIALDPDDNWNWYQLGPLLARKGDLAGYHKHREAMIDHFRNTGDPATAERAAKVYFLASPGGSKVDLANTIAERAVTVGSNHQWVAYFQLTKGLAEYRQGRFTKAVEWLQRALERVGQVPDRDAQAYQVLAMARHQLKQFEEARVALARGAEIVQTKLPQLDSGDLGNSWHDVLIAHMLMREAQDLVAPSAKR